MDQPLIEFHFERAEERELFPRPYPARDGFPGWLRPTGFPGASGLRDDPGFVAATGAGYVIPLVYDCEFKCDEKGNVSFAATGPVSTQIPAQYHGTWFESMVLIKFANPWIIKTPPGYSTLIVPAINRFDIPFQPLAGVIETDSYSIDVQFPSLSLMRPGQTCTLKRGLPLVQAIPILRENWRSIAGELGLAPEAMFR